MSAPAIDVGPLIELQADRFGFIDEDDAYRAARSVCADGTRALVLVHGVISDANASLGAAHQVGAALCYAQSIDVRGNGPGLAEFAGRVRAAADEEQRFRANGTP